MFGVGGSCIIDPYGHYVTDPVWDEETIIYAELDMDLPAACKMEHDAVGHYARPDVLQLIITDRQIQIDEGACKFTMRDLDKHTCRKEKAEKAKSLKTNGTRVI